MTYSPLQFQHGLSLVQFLDRYGTEEKCAQAIFQARWRKGFECPECSAREHCLLFARSLYQCNVCHRQTSLTAGTILHGTHLPLRKWFLAMYELTQGKHGSRLWN